MSKSLIAATLFAILSTAPGAAQIAVRESFAAAQLTTKPASFLWTVEDEPEDVSFGTIDVGIRYSLDTPFLGLGTLIAGPTLEWHKLGRQTNEQDRYSIGGSGELILSTIALPWLGSPYLSGQVAVERDRVVDEDGVAASVAATFFSTRPGAPGSQNQLWPRSMLRYYPHLGVERHPDVIGTDNATLAFIKLNLEFWPWVGRIQTLGVYTIRGELGDAILPDDLDSRSFGINAYIDAEERVGFGVEYVKGAQPKESFSQAERTIIGFKVKI